MTPHEELLVHPQPVNKTAALHIAGGDRLGRDELLWAQREAFERAMIDARIRNMEYEQKNRRTLARASKKLEALPPENHYAWDFTKHVNKLRSRVGINQRLDERIRKTTAARLAREPSPEPKPSTGAMLRRNRKRYGKKVSGPFTYITAHP
jgi:hypothetical protein